jgi:hypothetical protein
MVSFLCVVSRRESRESLPLGYDLVQKALDVSPAYLRTFWLL